MARLPASDLFPTEGPVAADELIGRSSDIEALVRALENRTHRVLAAPRRLGKTTVCRAALEQLRARGFYTVSIDLWRAADQEEMASALVAKTIENRPALKKLPHLLRKQGGKAADLVAGGASAKLSAELGQEVEVAWKPSLAARDPRGYLTYSLELLQDIAERDDKQIIVFFDEFQSVVDFEAGGPPQAIQKLARTVFQDSDRVACLFAGSLEHLMRDIFSAQEPLGNFGGFHQLSEIDRDEWREGLRERLARDKSTITDNALDLLFELGALHPRVTMLVCQHAYIAAITEDARELDESLIRVGHAQARLHEQPRHQSQVDRIRKLGGSKTKQLALKLCKQIARSEQPYSGVSSQDKPPVGRALNALRDAGYIESVGHGQGWRIVDPLFQLYLAELDAST